MDEKIFMPLIFLVIIVAGVYNMNKEKWANYALENSVAACNCPVCPTYPDASYPRYTVPDVYERDRLELVDPLYPPEQRSDTGYADRYLQNAYNGYFRQPTRGYPPPYQMKGYLVDQSNESNILSLFGRPKYVGSTQYQYYILRNDVNNNQIKIPIKQDRELFDGDIIKLNTGIYNGEYKYVALPLEDLIQPPIF